jgi:hypothetical protein
MYEILTEKIYEKYSTTLKIKEDAECKLCR